MPEKDHIEIIPGIDKKSCPSKNCKDYYPFGLSFNGWQRIGVKENKYLYNGKELQDETTWYDFGARMQDPALGRFFAQDRFAEKYYDLTPYHYGANNPILYIDINGDSLWINTGFRNLLYEDGKLYNKKGKEVRKKLTAKDGGSSFLAKTVGALKTIGGEQEGSDLINELQSSNYNVVIEKGNGAYKAENENWTDAQNGTGVGGSVRWTTLNQDALGNSRPGFVGLAHELGHAQNGINGNMDLGVWFSVSTSQGTQPIRNAEQYGSHIENLIRAEHGIPLRSIYQPGYQVSRLLVPGTSVGIHYGIDYYKNHQQNRMNSRLQFLNKKGQ